MQILRILYLLAAVATGSVPASLHASEQAVSIPSEQALDALQKLLSAHATGNQKQLEALVEPKLIGYSRVVNPTRDAGLTQKQLALSLSDTRAQVSEDVVIIQTHWEKRYVSIPGRIGRHFSGTCTFVMRPSAGVWRLSALTGDSPFGPD